MRLHLTLFTTLLLSGIQATHAALNVFACESHWASLVTELGGDQVEVFSATTGNHNPHRVPSNINLLNSLNRADLLICTGAGMEHTWLPLLLAESDNRAVQAGQIGHLIAAEEVRLLPLPSKSYPHHMDAHVTGNPNFHLDPYRISQIAFAITDRLKHIAPDQAQLFDNLHNDFQQLWQQSITHWEQRAEPLFGTRYVVQQYEWAYLFDWLDLTEVGILEPQSGRPSNLHYLTELTLELKKEPAQAILLTPYQNPHTASWLTKQANLPIITLPYTLDPERGIDDLHSLIGRTISLLLESGH